MKRGCSIIGVNRVVIERATSFSRTILNVLWLFTHLYSIGSLLIPVNVVISYSLALESHFCKLVAYSSRMECHRVCQIVWRQNYFCWVVFLSSSLFIIIIITFGFKFLWWSYSWFSSAEIVVDPQDRSSGKLSSSLFVQFHVIELSP